MSDENKDKQTQQDTPGMRGYIKLPPRRLRRYIQQDDNLLKAKLDLNKSSVSQPQEQKPAPQNTPQGAAQNAGTQKKDFSVHIRPLGSPQTAGAQEAPAATPSAAEEPEQRESGVTGLMDNAAVYIVKRFKGGGEDNTNGFRSFIKSFFITALALLAIFSAVAIMNWRDAKWREEFDRRREENARLSAQNEAKYRQALTAQEQAQMQEEERRRRLQKLGTFMPVEEELKAESLKPSTEILRQAIKDDKDKIVLAGEEEDTNATPDVNYSAQVAAYREQVKKQKEAEEAEAKRQALVLAEKKKQEEIARAKAQAEKARQEALRKGKDVTADGKVITKVNKLETSKMTGKADIFNSSDKFNQGK